mmetsp:Transcript_9553/g.28512  ORF Transcript_9553/g.28512 Transcript_9553/m.28512 type:complete len:94 (+) Transcript_9553:2014-2295(+)
MTIIHAPVVIIGFGVFHGEDDVDAGILSTAKANRTHPAKLSDSRQKRARNCTSIGSTSMFSSKHGDKRMRQRKDRIAGPANVRGTTPGYCKWS